MKGVKGNHYFILTEYFLNRDFSLHAAESFMNSADFSGAPLEYAEYQFIVLIRGNWLVNKNVCR